MVRHETGTWKGQLVVVEAFDINGRAFEASALQYESAQTAPLLLDTNRRVITAGDMAERTVTVHGTLWFGINAFEAGGNQRVARRERQGSTECAIVVKCGPRTVSE